MRPLKILVVDDEPAIIDFTKKVYDRRGYRTFGATDGLEAVEIFRRERTDVNFIDVHMPFSPIDGVEVLKRIRAIDGNACCIMVTRIQEAEPIQRSRELGAKHYLIKPIAIEEMDAYIEETAQLLRAEEKVDEQTP